PSRDTARPPGPPVSVFTGTPPTGPPPLSLHDALPILLPIRQARQARRPGRPTARQRLEQAFQTALHPHQLGSTAAELMRMQRSLDRKSTRLNSSHVKISYAVFCLKKKKQQLPRRSRDA